MPKSPLPILANPGYDVSKAEKAAFEIGQLLGATGLPGRARTDILLNALVYEAVSNKIPLERLQEAIESYILILAGTN
jgi:hypothetical protein